MSLRVFFYVQHLLGIGHMKRAALISRAMATAGLDVTVVVGGFDVPDLDFGPVRRIQLPPVRASDQYFTDLLDENDRPIDEAWKKRRRDALMDAFITTNPDVLLFELFPFGRRQFRFEIMPVLQAARARAKPPWILSSVRDVLVQKPKAKRNLEMIEVAKTWFDLILVHGDADLIPFEATFPDAAAISDKIIYTGYVVDSNIATSQNQGDGSDEVIVSVGGGAVGEPLLHCAIAARELSAMSQQTGSQRTWRLLVGLNLPDRIVADLAKEAPPGIIVERARGDFPALLRRCAVSVSQGGYNTIMDVLQAGVRAVVVPFAAGDESEQSHRAARLGERGHLITVAQATLTPGILARAVDRAAQLHPPQISGIDFTGAQTTARIIADLSDKIPGEIAS